MTYRVIRSMLAAILFLLAGQSLALAADCASCDRGFANCRSPIQAKYVSCMNGSGASCGSKCASDCKNDQKCTYACVKTCQGGSSSCQGSFTSASAQCMNTYKSCKNGCTVTR
jgi:hypothetical protein